MAERVRVDADEVRAQPEIPNLVVSITSDRIAWRIGPALWTGTEAAAAAVRVHAATGTFHLAGPGAGPEATAANILADLRSLA